MTTKEEFSKWFDDGVAQGAKYMLIICDTFDHEDYPAYASQASECMALNNYPGEMQRVMEVYDLSADKETQLNEHRAMSLPT